MAVNKPLIFLFAFLCILQLRNIYASQTPSDNIYGANITVQPVSINTTLNSTVVFHCEAVGLFVDASALELIFYVNDEQASDESVMADGFDATTNVVDGSKVGKLTAMAYDYNNNTNISCTVISYSPLDVNAEPSVEHSDTALLMIQGPLDDVGNLNYTIINGSSVLITWTSPYTLDNVPITGYLVNGTQHTNDTNITLSTTDPKRCTLYTVSVSAINDAGVGSSNYINFYYETVPPMIPKVSVFPEADDANLFLNIQIYVDELLCDSEYPNNITVIILNVDNEIQESYSIPPEVHNQMETIEGQVSMPNNLTAFTVTISMSNMGGEFLPTQSFRYAKVGPVTDIKPSPENCNVLNITWSAPHNSSTILGYHFILFDNTTGAVLIEQHVFPHTNFQFDDTDLFNRRYRFVITGINELGDGISNEAIFSFQRVPKSVEGTSVHFIKQDQDNHNNSVYKLSIPVKFECAREAPMNCSISILCNETELVYENTSLVEYSFGIQNITRNVSVPMHQQCNITIVFSKGVGQSEPFILAFDTTPVASTSTTPSPTSTPTNTSLKKRNIIIISCVTAGVVVFIVIFITISCLCICRYRYKKTGKVDFLCLKKK